MKIQCDLEGGLLFLDSSRVRRFDDEQIYRLCIAMDYEGESEICYDFPGEPWTQVWSRETLQIVEQMRQGDLGLIVLPAGNYEVVPQSHQSSVTGLERQCSFQLRVPSKTISIIETGALVSSGSCLETTPMISVDVSASNVLLNIYLGLRESPQAQPSNGEHTKNILVEIVPMDDVSASSMSQVEALPILRG